MTHTSRHLLLAFAWLLGFVVLVILLSSSFDLSDIGKNQYRGQLGSIIWVLGFAGIFFSWARLDASAHGKSKGTAVLFAVFWPFFLVVAHIAYLFYTRGLRNGLLASLKFVCFCLAAVISMVAMGKLWGLISP